MKKIIILITFIIVLVYIMMSCTTEPEDITLYNNPASPSYAAQTNKSISAPSVNYLYYSGSKIIVNFICLAPSQERYLMDLKSDGSIVMSSHPFLYSTTGYYEINKSAGASYNITAMCRDSIGFCTTSTDNISAVVPAIPSGSKIGKLYGQVSYNSKGIAGLYIISVNNNNQYYAKTIAGQGGYYELTEIATNGVSFLFNIDIYVYEKLLDGSYINLGIAAANTVTVGSTSVKKDIPLIFPPE